MNILKAARPLNLLILVVAQILCSYFLGFGNSLTDIFDKPHISIYVTTMLCSVFGYLFNDYMDGKADSINRPGSSYLVLPGHRNLALFIAILSAIVAIILGFLMSYRLGVLITLIVSLLFFYSSLLKRLPLLGNIIVALLGAFSIYILLAFDENLNRELILIFSINAFGIHLIREIIKDAEDIEGDAFAGYKTFPVIAGIKATRLLLIGVSFLYILVFTTCVRLMMMRYFSAPLSYVFLTYNVICIGIPLFHLLSRIQLAADKLDFEYMSKVALYIMVTGLLSLMFF